MATRARALTAAALAVAAAVTAATLGAAASSPRREVLIVARDDGLWRVRADGGALRLPGTNGARAPAWAPNGRELAFERDGTVYGANADGTGIRPLLAGAARQRQRTSARRRAGLLARLHRSVPAPRPRPEPRTHRRAGRDLRARPPREPGRTSPRAPLRQQRRVCAHPARADARRTFGPRSQVLRGLRALLSGARLIPPADRRSALAAGPL